MVGKPLKGAALPSVRTLGCKARLSERSPGVATVVAVLLSALLDGVCPAPGALMMGMLTECSKVTFFLEGVPCTALMLSSKPLRSCT